MIQTFSFIVFGHMNNVINVPRRVQKSSSLVALFASSSFFLFYKENRNSNLPSLIVVCIYIHIQFIVKIQIHSTLFKHLSLFQLQRNYFVQAF